MNNVIELKDCKVDQSKCATLKHIFKMFTDEAMEYFIGNKPGSVKSDDIVELLFDNNNDLCDRYIPQLEICCGILEPNQDDTDNMIIMLSWVAANEVNVCQIINDLLIDYKPKFKFQR